MLSQSSARKGDLTLPEKGLIIKALSGFYYVRDAEGRVFQTKPRGIFRHKEQSPLVGDQVIFESETAEEGTIVQILDRKNFLKRPPIANVDVGVIIASTVTPNLSTLLLDRFLILLESLQIEPVIYISKYDLATDKIKEEVQHLKNVYEELGYHFIVIEAQDKEEFQSQVQQAFAKELSDHILVFMGQSGAGKSTLLNHLDPKLQLETNETSEALGRGRHTTRHVELMPLYDGWFADTPGFSTVNLPELSAFELSACFPEIWALHDQCKFNTCTHQNEPQCAVKNAVENEKIEKFRYEHYLLFLEEMQSKKTRY